MGLFDAFKFTMTLDSKSFQNSMKRANSITVLVNKNTKAMNKQIKTIDRVMRNYAQSVSKVGKSLNTITDSSNRAISSFNKMGKTISEDTKTVVNNFRNMSTSAKTAFTGASKEINNFVSSVNSMATSVATLNSQMRGVSTSTQIATYSGKEFNSVKEKGTKTVKTFNTSLRNSRKASGQYVMGISEAYNATDLLGASISKVVRLVRTVFYFEIAGKYVDKLTSSYLEQESALIRLNKLMKNVVNTTTEDVQEIADLAKEMQNYTTFSRDALQVGASQLSTFFLQKESIEQLLPAYTDLLAGIYGVNVTQKEAIHGANLLGKAFAGLPGMLRRWGVMLSEEQSTLIKTGTEAERVAVLVDVLKMNFGGLSEALANTREGEIARTKVALRELGKTFGAILMPLVDKTRITIMNFATSMVDLLKEPTKIIEKLSTKITNFYKELSTGAKAIFLFASAFVVLKITAGIINNLTKITMVFIKLFTGGGNPVFTTLLLFYTGFVAIRAVMQTLGIETNQWATSLSDAYQQVKDITSKVITWTVDIAGNMWDWIVSNKDVIQGGFFGALEWAFNTGKHATTFIIDIAGSLWDAGKSSWNALKDLISNIPENKNINFELKLTNEDIFKSVLTGLFAGLGVLPFGAGWKTSIVVGLTVGGMTALASGLRNRYAEIEQNLSKEVEVTLTQGDSNKFYSVITNSIDNLELSSKQRLQELQDSMIEIAKQPESLFTDFQLVFTELGVILYDVISRGIVEGSRLIDKYIVTPVQKLFTWIGDKTTALFKEVGNMIDTYIVEPINKLVQFILDLPNKFTNSLKTNSNAQSAVDIMSRADTGSFSLPSGGERYNQQGSTFWNMMMNLLKGNKNGSVPRFASGAILKQNGKIVGEGTGTSDSILARVSNGEAIINAKSTQKYMPILEAINKDKLPEYAKGNLGAINSGLVTENSTVADVNIVGVTGGASTFFNEVWKNSLKIVQEDLGNLNGYFEELLQITGLDEQLEKIEGLIKDMDVVKDIAEFQNQTTKTFDELMNGMKDVVSEFRKETIQKLEGILSSSGSLGDIAKSFDPSWAEKLVDTIGGFKTYDREIYSETDPTLVTGTERVTEKVRVAPAESFVDKATGKEGTMQFGSLDSIINTITSTFGNLFKPSTPGDKVGNINATGDEDKGISVLSEIVDFMSTSVTGLIGTVGESFSGLNTGIGNFISNIPVAGNLLAKPFEMLSGVTQMATGALTSFTTPLAILTPIFQGIATILQPVVDRILKPIITLFTTLGETIGTLISIFITPLMIVLTPIIWLFNSLSWALDQFILWANDLWFVGGFLSADQIKEKRKSIDERMGEYATPPESTDRTIEGEKFQAGGTRTTINNINAVFKDNIMLEDDKQAVKRLFDMFVKYMQDNVDKDFQFS
ncbi:hypothetical protein [Oceanotoga phage vB_OteS-UFV02]